MTKLSPTLPKDIDDDGLASINGKLINTPYEQHIVIAIVDCKTITTDIDSGFREATARVVACEPIRDEAVADRVREIFDAARQRRLNRPGLFDEPAEDQAEGDSDDEIVEAEIVPELVGAAAKAIEA
jgi:hypothetical protein